jgi:hypothetical protein
MALRIRFGDMPAQMTHIVSTAVLNLLVQRRMLAARLRSVGLGPDSLEFLQALRRAGALPISEHVERLPLDKMMEHRLVAREAIAARDVQQRRRALRRQGRELFLLQGVNFEITYRCGLSCGHCLQRNLREIELTELAPDRVIRALRQAWFAALPLAGVNLTGGEPLFAGSSVLDLIREAASLGLRVRLNTNSWWGEGQRLRVGDQAFADASALVAHLREIGLSMFAFSFDERYRQNDRALGTLIGAMRACEEHRMPYQIVCTGLDVDELEAAWQLAWSAAAFPLDHALPVVMRKVDLGGAAGSLLGAHCDSSCGCGVADREPGDEDPQFCKGLGYYRPSYLHISPTGAIRSCLYAPQLGNLGDLAREDLLDAVNRFPSDPVSLAFQHNELSAHHERLLAPHSALYRPVVHPCAACAVLARLIDEASRFASTHGHPADGPDLEQIHLRIAREYNLLRT